MRSIALAVFFVTGALHGAHAEQISGTWHGLIEGYTYGNPNRTLIVTPNSGTANCTWDEVGKTTNYPASCIINGNHASLTTGAGSTIALVLEDNVLHGTFTLKNGQQYPVSMGRTSASVSSIASQDQQTVFKAEIGKAIDYKGLPGWAGLTPDMKDWYARSFGKRVYEGNNKCLFKNFDVQGAISNIEGACIISAEEMADIFQGRTVARFSASLENGGSVYPNSDMHMVCRPAPGIFEGNYWDGIVALCQISYLTIPGGQDYTGPTRYAFYMMDLWHNGKYVPMNAFEANSNSWIDLEKLQRKLGKLPVGLPGLSGIPRR
jgi:hypothetical protein